MPVRWGLLWIGLSVWGHAQGLSLFPCDLVAQTSGAEYAHTPLQWASKITEENPQTRDLPKLGPWQLLGKTPIALQQQCRPQDVQGNRYWPVIWNRLYQRPALVTGKLRLRYDSPQALASDQAWLKNAYKKVHFYASPSLWLVVQIPQSNLDDVINQLQIRHQVAHISPELWENKRRLR
ncbi:MAG: hypothetical protein IE936_13445 [Moraxella osloensis]|nr:hypothetical protein [Moraxella osloensis]